MRTQYGYDDKPTETFFDLYKYFDIQGKYNYARVFTDYVESEAQSQIIEMLNMKIF